MAKTTKKTTAKKALTKRAPSQEIIPQKNLGRITRLQGEIAKLSAAHSAAIAPLNRELAELVKSVAKLHDAGAKTEAGKLYPDVEIEPGQQKRPKYAGWFTDTVTAVVAKLTTTMTRTRVADMRKDIGALINEDLKGGPAELVEHLKGQLGFGEDKRMLVIKSRNSDTDE